MLLTVLRKWLGVAGTDKKIDSKCLIMMKVCFSNDLRLKTDFSLTLKVG
jgi:hypothetical protein